MPKPEGTVSSAWGRAGLSGRNAVERAWHWSFGIPSDFDIRHSDLRAGLWPECRVHSRCPSTQMLGEDEHPDRVSRLVRQRVPRALP
jgi:hypothetical protein